MNAVGTRERAQGNLSTIPIGGNGTMRGSRTHKGRTAPPQEGDRRQRLEGYKGRIYACICLIYTLEMSRQ